ncbi:MAG: hypothetical protein PHY09_17015 [Desulfuromonadaceae bacterium]|nr:hypothetical protein [Desulfuromonadaceae bacterium]
MPPDACFSGKPCCTKDVIENRDARVDEGSLLMKPIPLFELLQLMREAFDRWFGCCSRVWRDEFLPDSIL